MAAADPASISETITAAAQPSENGSHLTGITQESDTEFTAHVYSAAMDKDIELHVLRPAGPIEARPTLYLLNGAGGGEDESGIDWKDRTDVVEFFADKNVNVVIPIGGQTSYYTDWQQEDPVLGRNQWTTFFTEELPPVVDSALGGNGRNAIAGLSMSGTSVLALAESSPGLYDAVAAYSGCASTSDPVGQAYVRTVVEARGGGNTHNMWGAVGDGGWAANDPLLHAEKLRGTAVYISSGSGLIGDHDNLNAPDVQGDPSVLAQQIVVGGVIEAATNECSHRMKERLDSLGIPATYNFRARGTHSWGYWEDDLHDSWPMIAKAVGL
ncbi:MAG: esterase family protein [Rhodococcus sp.]|nr:esterase family protein [Rhodococcus sp. (in: high G+C Gram-positive bacteria)]